MSNQQNQSQEDPDVQDRKCVECGAWRTKDSAYCNMHKEGVQTFMAKRAVNAQKKAELKKRLEEKEYSIKTVQDVQDLTQDVINGIMKGDIKRDKSGPLGMYIMLAHKMAKDLEGKAVNNTFSIDVSKNNVKITMSDQKMDEFLRDGPALRIEMLKEMQAAGEIETKTDGETFDVQVKDVTPEKIKIDTKGLAKLSSKTDVPITPAQAKNLFGQTLADDSPIKDVVRGQDAVGFGHLYEEKNLPIHKYKGKYESDVAQGKAFLWFTCEYCGDRQPNVNKNICDKAPVVTHE